MHWRASQVLPLSEANLSMDLKNGFLSHSFHKTAAAIVSDFGRGGLGCDVEGGATSLRCQWWRQWGSAEKDELRESEVVEKVKVMDGSGMIIGEILCLFLLLKLPILLVPLCFPPSHGWVNCKPRKQVKSDAKNGIFCHDDWKDLGLPNSLLFQVGTNWSR